MSVDLHATSFIKAVKPITCAEDGPPYFSIKNNEPMKT